MNPKLLLKWLLVMLVLLLLILMGMNNRELVPFVLPPLIPRRVQLPGALMFFAFFAIGLLTGLFIRTGGGKKGAGSARSGGDRK